MESTHTPAAANEFAVPAEPAAAARNLPFASDYMEGAHPQLLDALMRINAEPCTGYGYDVHSEAARELIRRACAAPEADVFFLAGGTQANACVIDCMLRPWQGVMAAETGHVNGHEAGAIEHGGHKVIALAQSAGKVQANTVEACLTTWENDANRDHIVQPGMLYISQPTEYGTLYTRAELEKLSEVCHSHGATLYVDGARLAYALAASENDVTLADLARYTDAFYIGGTKCGCLLGEAVVFPKHDSVPHFFSMIKQHGALLAKGFVVGAQFEELFRDGLYLRIGDGAIAAANRIRAATRELGYELALESPTNQVFITLNDKALAALSEQVDMGFWEHTSDGRTVMRLATSWATREEDVDKLIRILKTCA